MSLVIGNKGENGKDLDVVQALRYGGLGWILSIVMSSYWKFSRNDEMAPSY
jgi:hypothetical protein